jgi:2-polyprenyl-6-hydroxyphenyl methylase/3-demethylubiquinone-9 3-methyltransferase
MLDRAAHPVGRLREVSRMVDSDRYYADRLSAERLRECYAVAPPRVGQYLEAEIQHVLGKIRPSDTVLELGCGYGRVLGRLATRADTVVGIDNSRASLELAQSELSVFSNCRLLTMNAAALGFRDGVFDVVVCIQNGVSAFKVNPRALIAESVRVTRPGGTVLLSSYARGFWDARLEWFELQAHHGLIGRIDRSRTGDGTIVCEDGFKATTVGPAEFLSFCSPLGVNARTEEVDGSSLFCEIHVAR